MPDKTLLLLWNPQLWSWNYLDDSIAHVAKYGHYEDIWNCGSRKNVNIGDRFYLNRLGPDVNGIVASGVITSYVFKNPHFDEKRAAEGKEQNTVKIRFDAIRKAPIISMAELDKLVQPEIEKFQWNPRAGGIEIPTYLSEQVEQEWVSRDPERQTRLPEDMASCPVFVEGGVRRVTVNTYERNPKARKKCLEHYSHSCACCDTLLSNVYGEIADRFIHVHHRKPLSEINGPYEVDPIKDLVPVCPNCHAIMHLKNTPLTVDDVKNLIAANSN